MAASVDRLQHRGAVCGGALQLAWELLNERARMRARMRTVALVLFVGACSLAASGCRHASASAAAHGTTPLAAPAPEAQFERGATLAARARYAEAERALAAALDGGYAPAHVLPLLVDVCASNRHFRRAVDYATPYLQLHPGDFQLRYRVAAALLQLGSYERARQELERVLERAPNFAPAHYLLAVTLRDHFRQTHEAAAHFSAYHRLSTRGTHGARSNDRRSLL